jgi:hypothetical protein
LEVVSGVSPKAAPKRPSFCKTETADKLHEVCPAGNGVAQRDTCPAQPAQQHIPGLSHAKEFGAT